MTDTTHQVVGIDGSPGSRTALEWAAARTDRFGLIKPVAAWVKPWWAAGPPVPGATQIPTNDELHAQAHDLATSVLADTDPSILLEPETVYAEPGPALVAAAASEALLVVGSRGHGALAGALLGSVSMYCVNHATTPVAVIPKDAFPDEPFGRVLVGIDGSDHSISALTWALSTTPESMAIDALFVWAYGTPFSEQAILDGVDVAERARDIAERVAERARTMADKPSREIWVGTVRGDARSELRTEAAKADLLVVGARGREGLAHLVLGSVTTSLVHDPATPTVVVR
jgi:nucleotide-binding universal stress UspA family protein